MKDQSLEPADVAHADAVTDASSADPRAEGRRERRAMRVVAGAFSAAMLAGLALVGLYILGGQTQLEGVLIALLLGGIGLGLVVWSHALMPVPTRVERRHRLGSRQAARDALVKDLTTEGGVARRTVLVRLLVGALASLAAALALPVLSLGPAPGRSLFQTAWRRGLRLVDGDGRVVTAASMEIGSIVTVFPEGAVGAADSQTVLLRVDPVRLQLAGPAADWAPDGYVAYSKVCTHAGCPVGLYREASNELICPCHQSTFDALRGAIQPPARRPDHCRNSRSVWRMTARSARYRTSPNRSDRASGISTDEPPERSDRMGGRPNGAGPRRSVGGGQGIPGSIGRSCWARWRSSVSSSCWPRAPS